MEHLDLGGIRMNSKKALVLLVLANICCFAAADTQDTVRERLAAVHKQIPSRRLEGIVGEVLNFESFGRYTSYQDFAVAVSNDWRSVLGSFNAITTNKVDRLLLLGVGKQFDEDFYIDYISELCVLCTNNIITSGEMDWAITSTRYDLQSCFIRRYKESKIIALLNSLKSVFPNRLLWDRILSGERYTNYLHEVEAGLWGPNGKKVQ